MSTKEEPHGAHESDRRAIYWTLGIIAAIIIAVLVVGYFLGWFTQMPAQ